MEQPPQKFITLRHFLIAGLLALSISLAVQRIYTGEMLVLAEKIYTIVLGASVVCYTLWRRLQGFQFRKEKYYDYLRTAAVILFGIGIIARAVHEMGSLFNGIGMLLYLISFDDDPRQPHRKKLQTQEVREEH